METASAPVLAGEAQRLVGGADIRADWWTMFGSPPLRHLVERALEANPSITAAEATLRQAQALVAAQRGFFLPAVVGGYSFLRQQLAGNAGGNSPRLQGNGTIIQASGTKPAIFSFPTAQLQVGFTPGVFGGVRRSVEGARAQAEAARFQMEAARITLVANVVAAALQEAAVRAEIAAVNDIVAVNQEGLRILDAQFRAGTAQAVDVAAQDSSLAAAQALLPPSPFSSSSPAT